MHSSKTLLPACLAILLLGLATSPRALEIPPELRKKMMLETDKRSVSILGQDMLDNSLDPERYLVGGGDRFQISIVGMPSQEYFPVVDPEGNIYDGDLGLIPVGKVPMSKAKHLIAEKVKKSLRRNYEVYVTINRIKTSTVSVTGLVSNPGTLSLPGNVRILDAIKLANLGVLPSGDKFNLRAVRVRNGDSLKEYDLYRFLNKQDLDHNPYLYPGDQIALDQVDARVYVAGEIRDFVSGWVPVKPGETAGDILSLVNLKGTADSSAILIQQSGKPGQPAPKHMTMAEAAGIPISNNDVISVGPKANEGRADTVRVSGEAQRPGTYSVPPGGGSVDAIVELAGGSTEHGNRAGTYILRHRKLEDLSPMAADERTASPFSMALKQSSGSLQAVRPEVASSYNDLHAIGDFILIDAAGKGGAVPLEDGDELVIPRKETCVYVSGNVRKPGAYPFKSGADFLDYIDAAQGFTNKADSKNSYVLAVYSGISQVKDVRDLAAGNIIVVPAAIEYKRWANVFMPIVQLVPGILSLIVTLIVLEQQTK